MGMGLSVLHSVLEYLVSEPDFYSLPVLLLSSVWISQRLRACNADGWRVGRAIVVLPTLVLPLLFAHGVIAAIALPIYRRYWMSAR